MPTFFGTSYKMRCYFCENRRNSLSEPSERNRNETPEQIQQPDGRHAQRQLIEEKAQKASGGVVGAEHALGAGTGIAQQHDG